MTYTGLGLARSRTGDAGHEYDVYECGEEAADGAPLHGHGKHAVHHKEDEHVVPDHDVTVQLEPGLLGAEAVEYAT